MRSDASFSTKKAWMRAFWLTCITLLLAFVGGLRQRLVGPPERSMLEVLMQPTGKLKDLIKPILIPRPVGSSNLTQVRSYLTDFLTKNGWTVEEHKTTYEIQGKSYEFVNIIATVHPTASKFLTLSAHYDSKNTPEGFMGATDSAAPCALLLDLAARMGPVVKQKRNPLVSLQLVFFDGEEAMFGQWTHEDSVYGSRRLAEQWAKDQPTWSGEYPTSLVEKKNRLDQIDALMLLDLLGATDPWPVIPDYYRETSSLYNYLKLVEQTLLDAGLLSELRRKTSAYFQGTSFNNRPDDDHRHFMERQVPILHLIPHPFPRVWHDISDNATALSYDILEDYNRILRVFIYKYLDLTCL